MADQYLVDIGGPLRSATSVNSWRSLNPTRSTLPVPYLAVDASASTVRCGKPSPYHLGAGRSIEVVDADYGVCVGRTQSSWYGAAAAVCCCTVRTTAPALKVDKARIVVPFTDQL